MNTPLFNEDGSITNEGRIIENKLVETFSPTIEYYINKCDFFELNYLLTSALDMAILRAKILNKK